jgi:hypothetical protein
LHNNGSKSLADFDLGDSDRSKKKGVVMNIYNMLVVAILVSILAGCTSERKGVKSLFLTNQQNADSKFQDFLKSLVALCPVKDLRPTTLFPEFNYSTGMLRHLSRIKI